MLPRVWAREHVGVVSIRCLASITRLKFRHIKPGVVGCTYMFFSAYSLRYISTENYQNYMISDKVITNIKRVTLLEKQCMYMYTVSA